MKRVALAVILFSSLSGAGLSPAFAEEEGMALSYAQQDADTK